MQLGIFAKTFERPSLEETFDAVASHDLRCVQFNFSITGLPTLPDEVGEDLAARIRREAAARSIEIAAVSATFNMADPDPRIRSDGLRRLHVLAEACVQIGAPVITLCTGSRHATDMWCSHPGNAEPDAWDDLIACMRAAVAIAQDHGLTAAFEPEAANVVDTVQKARRLLDEIESPHLAVVIDPANLVHDNHLPLHTGEVIDEAFAVLGGDLVLAHAKDVAPGGGSGFSPAGHGVLDYDRYLDRMRVLAPGVPLVLHSLGESDVDGCVAFLRSKLSEAHE